MLSKNLFFVPGKRNHPEEEENPNTKRQKIEASHVVSSVTSYDQLWQRFNEKYPVFQFKTTQTVAPTGNIDHQHKIVKIQITAEMKQSCPQFSHFINQFTYDEVKNTILSAAKNKSRLNVDAVHILFSNEYIHPVIEELKQAEQEQPGSGLTENQVSRLHELIKLLPMDQHVLYYSTDYENIEKLAEIIHAGNFNTLEFKTLLNQPYFPYMILTLMNSPHGKNFCYAQLFTLLELHQAINPRKITGLDQPMQLTFPNNAEQLPEIFRVLNDNGEWSEHAQRYFLPFIRLNENHLAILKHLIQTFPTSEQLFYRLQGEPGPFGRVLSHAGAIYHHNENMIEPSCSIRNIIGVISRGEQFTPVMPQLGPKSIDMMEQGLLQQFQYGQMCIVTNQGGFAPIEVHGHKYETFFSLYKHDKLHSDICSSIPPECRAGLRRCIDIVREKTKCQWSYQLLYWSEGDYPFFKYNHHDLHNVSAMSQFCAMLDTSYNSGPLVGGILRNNSFETIEGIIAFLDMIENPHLWLVIGLDTSSLPDGNTCYTVDNQIAYHQPQGYQQKYKEYSSFLASIADFFKRPLARQVLFLQLLEIFPDLKDKSHSLLHFISLFELDFAKNYKLYISINGQYEHSQLDILHSLFCKLQHKLEQLTSIDIKEKFSLLCSLQKQFSESIRQMKEDFAAINWPDEDKNYSFFNHSGVLYFKNFIDQTLNKGLDIINRYFRFGDVMQNTLCEIQWKLTEFQLAYQGNSALQQQLDFCGRWKIPIENLRDAFAAELSCDATHSLPPPSDLSQVEEMTSRTQDDKAKYGAMPPGRVILHSGSLTPSNSLQHKESIEPLHLNDDKKQVIDQKNVKKVADILFQDLFPKKQSNHSADHQGNPLACFSLFIQHSFAQFYYS